MPSPVDMWSRSTTAPGLAPDREADMTGVAEAAWSSWWRFRRWPDFIAREIVGPLAVADLVAVQFDHSALKARKRAGIGPTGDYAALAAIHACRRAKRRTADLASILGMSGSATRRALRIAHDVGAIAQTDDGLHRTCDAWKPAGRRLVALELKKSDWRRATEQVWAYQAWAHAAWLVLGQPPPLSAVQGLTASGMGLAYIADDERIHVVLRPTTRRNQSGIATAWAAEQALEAALSAGFDPIRSAQSTRGPATLRGVAALSVG